MAIDLYKAKPDLSDIDPYLLTHVGVGVATVLILLLSFLFLILPQFARLGDINNKITEESALSQEKIEEVRREKNKKLSELEKEKQEILTIEKSLAEKKEISMLLDKFVITAKRRRLEFTYIKPLASSLTTLSLSNQASQSRAKGNAAANSISLVEMPIEIKLESGYTDFLGFLREIEQLEKTLGIKSLTIRGNEKNPSRHEESLVMSVYQLAGSQ